MDEYTYSKNLLPIESSVCNSEMRELFDSPSYSPPYIPTMQASKTEQREKLSIWNL